MRSFPEVPRTVFVESRWMGINKPLTGGPKRASLFCCCLLALGFLTVPVYAWSKPTRERCVARHSVTVYQDEYVRVFWRRSGGAAGARSRVLFGCRFRSDKRRRLGAYGGAGRSYIERGTIKVSGLRQASFYIAYVAAKCPTRTGCRQSVVVRDLKDGRVIFASPTYDKVHCLVLKENSSVAWIAEEDGGPVVSKHDSTGDQVVDSSAEIGMASLALSGNRIFWLAAAVPRSTSLD